MKRIALPAVKALWMGLAFVWAQQKPILPYGILPTPPAPPPNSAEIQEKPRFFLDKAGTDSILHQYELLMSQILSGELPPRWKENLLNLPHSPKQVVQCFTKDGHLISSITCENWKDKPCQRFIEACLTVDGIVVIADPSRSTAGALPPSEGKLDRETLSPSSGDNTPSHPLLFPNPTQGKATLQMPQVGPWTMYIYNSLGQLTLRHPFDGTEITFTLPPQKGLYWIVIEGSGQTYRLPLLQN